MIKVWCEECDGYGEVESRCIDDVWTTDCEACGGKGYTEYEGTFEDLELAQATKLAFENQHIPFTKITELIRWYREQKGVER